MRYLPGELSNSRVKFSSKDDRKASSGFTLVELIVVVGILAVLLAVVLVALNPAQRFIDTNNARRQADMNAILNAIHQSIADNRGLIPAGVGLTELQLGTGNTGLLCPAITTGGCTTAAGGCTNLTTSLVTTGYLGSIPQDPGAAGSQVTTRYTVVRNANNTITVKACDAEGTASPMSITR